ncbi:MAG: SUMF1/EgtB/PvdO family nonheme iron enzyme [Bacteroidota bacterium]
MRRTFAALLLLWCLLPGRSRANGVSIEKVSLNTETFAEITFTVSWKNAWNLDTMSAPGNHDAVWIFLKRDFNFVWDHLDLSPEPEHLSRNPEILRIQPVPDGKGVFLLPALAGAGDIPPTEVTLVLREPLESAAQIQFLIGAIEMVYVPEGPFWLGDGGSNQRLTAGDGVSPFRVTSEGTINFGSRPDELAADAVSGSATAVPEAWPKGYAGFYCMKYEISQQQYGDFLSTLTYAQQAVRMAAPPDSERGALLLAVEPGFRNGLRIGWPGNPESNNSGALIAHNLAGDDTDDGPGDGQNRACNYLNWDDVVAYLDWAALRPMTEFEFEKACRGPLEPVTGEFAWGTGAIIDANTVLDDGTATERVSEAGNSAAGLASHGYAGPQGPLRCGFAAGAATDRLGAGAGYWGAMELSGNMWELCVAPTPAGLLFTGECGDGILDAQGNANAAGWPAAMGAGHRGGGWNSGILPGFRDLAVSDRFYMDLPPTMRRNTTGGRGVR